MALSACRSTTWARAACWPPRAHRRSPAVATPVGVAVSPDGHSVYVANSDSDTVSQYDAGSGGALAAKTTPQAAHRPPQRAKQLPQDLHLGPRAPLATADSRSQR